MRPRRVGKIVKPKLLGSKPKPKLKPKDIAAAIAAVRRREAMGGTKRKPLTRAEEEKIMEKEEREHREKAGEGENPGAYT